MKKLFVFVEFSFIVCICLTFIVPNLLAKDDANTAAKLIKKVPANSQRPSFYTTKFGFMNDKDIATDSGTLDKGFYLFSWLVTAPCLSLGAGGGAASIGKDLYKDYFGIAEIDVSANSKNWPVAGLKSKKQNSKSEDMYWIPVNFQDTEAAGQGRSSSGNQFDWTEFIVGDQFHVYLFALIKWNKDTTVTLKGGSDDPQVTWVNGAKVCEGLGDRNWAKDTDVGTFEAKAGKWNAIFSEVGENGGECGFTMRIEPPPNDHTLDIEFAMSVNSESKLTTTWGFLKFIH